MADIDGTWNVIIKAPTGEQKAVLTVATAGDAFTGSFAGNDGTLEITDGKCDGETVSWDMDISKPMPLKLNCKLTATGDTADGSVKVGAFGSFPLVGTRA